MSFRQRLFCFFAVIILTLSVFEIVTDTLEQRRSLTIQANRALETLDNYADVAIRFEAGKPVENQGEPIPFDSRIRVLEGNAVLLTLDQSRPGAMFMTRERALSATQKLEVAVDTRLYREVLAQSFWRDLTYDIFNILLSLGLAWWLSGFALASLEKLNTSIHESVAQKFPSPVAVPVGNDVVSRLAKGFNGLFELNRFVLDRERVLMRYTAQEVGVPLHAMAEQIESLAMGSTSEERAIPSMQRHMERMQQVLQTLPSLAWLDDSVNSVSLIQLLKDTLQLIPDHDQSRIALKISATSNPKVARPTLVAQCLLSLLDNALQSKGEVKVSLEPYASLARIRVEDFGTALPEDYLQLLKQPLFQLPDVAPDRVLRLAFVRHILNSLEGTLEIRNIDRGIEVVMTLPVTEVSLSSTQINIPRQTKAPTIVKI